MIKNNSSIFSYFSKINSNFLLKASKIGLLAIVAQAVAAPNAFAGTALSTKQTFEGKVNYTVTGGTLRSSSDRVNACNVNSSSTAQLSGIPDNATVKKAYLYWAGSGSNVDSNITFDGTSLTADTTYEDNYAGMYKFFQGVKDVTDMVASKGNGSYQFSDLSVDRSSKYCNVKGVLSGWSMIVVYEDPSIDKYKLNTIELYEGFVASRNETVNYTLDGIQVAEDPEAKFSMLIWEGDVSLGGDDESFSFNGNTLIDSYNPENNQFNSSINTLRSTNTYGVDLDTFNVSSYVEEGDTSVTGTISTNDDLVLQGAALVSVTDVLANQSPEVQPDAIVTDEDTATTYNLITGDPASGAGRDEDPEGDELKLTKFTVDGTEYTFNSSDPDTASHSVTMPSGALLTVKKNGDVAYNPNGKFENLEPGEIAENSDQFSYTVTDEDDGTSTTDAVVSISGVADNPVAVDDNFRTDEDRAKRIHVLRNDSDPNTPKRNLKVTAINGTPVSLNGTYTLDSGAVITVKEVAAQYKDRNGDYTIHYDPTKSSSLNALNTGDPDAIETFTYTVSDPEGNTGEGSVTINVEGITDPFAD